jgi:uncharacterized protein with von Willebrand factor type A (vWA) domain
MSKDMIENGLNRGSNNTDIVKNFDVENYLAEKIELIKKLDKDITVTEVQLQNLKRLRQEAMKREVADFNNRTGMAMLRSRYNIQSEALNEQLMEVADQDLEKFPELNKGISRKPIE